MVKSLPIQLALDRRIHLFQEMLETALEGLPENHQLMMHSDQGWHYQMKQYRHALQKEVSYKVCLVKVTVMTTQ